MPSMPDPAFEQRVGAVRRFSRFYTREIGLLQAGWLNSPFSLTQARVLYELSRRKACTASDLAAELGLDHGYLSRILRGFADDGLITRQRSKDDGRQSVLSLTAQGPQGLRAARCALAARGRRVDRRSSAARINRAWSTPWARSKR